MIDAGWADECLGAEAGISAVRVIGPPGNAAPKCWSLCESGSTGKPNEILDIKEDSPGVYLITLARPITPGHCTSVIYNETMGMPSEQTFMSLPGDVDGNGTANPQDVLALIDVLNGVWTSPWGDYSTDVDRSGATNAVDVLALIDVLNGAGGCTPWYNVSLPEGCGICPDMP